MLEAPKTNHHFKKRTLLTLALASLSSTGWAIYPNVDDMLQAARPTFSCPHSGSEFCNLYRNLDQLVPTPDQRYDALQTLIPSADGSLRAASDATMWLVVQTINQRLMRVIPKDAVSGYASGDETGFVSPRKPAFQTKLTPIPVVGNAQPGDNAVNADETSVNSKEHEELEKKFQSAKDHANDHAKDKPVEKATKHELNMEEKLKEEHAREDSSVPQVQVKVDNREPDKGIWIQVLGSDIGQKNRNWVPGYDAQVLGAVIGRDLLFTPNLTVGLAGGYQNAYVTSRGPSGSNLDIKRFQGTLYAGYNFDRPFYFNAALTVAGNDYDNNRQILVPDVRYDRPIVNIAHSDFDAWEVDGYLEFGYVWQCNHLRVIPKFVGLYTHFDVGAYYEQDAFGLDMQVKYQHMDSLPLGIGAKLEYINEFENAYVVPEIHAYVFYDFVNDTQNAVASMLGGGFPFYSLGAQAAATSLELGAAMMVHSYQNIVVDFQYDFVTRTDYHRNSAFIKLRYEWA